MIMFTDEDYVIRLKTWITENIFCTLTQLFHLGRFYQSEKYYTTHDLLVPSYMYKCQGLAVKMLKCK
jgi:hypothetical protein